MIYNDTHSSVNWQWTACAVATVCIDIGLFLGGAYYLSSQPTISYCLFGAGGGVALGALIFLIIHSCKKSSKEPESIPHPSASSQDELPSEVKEESLVVTEPLVVTPPERKDLQVIPRYQYNPNANLFCQYAQSVGGLDEAYKLLKDHGNKIGDYVIFENSGECYEFKVAYVDSDGQVKSLKICNPLKWGGQIYLPEYEKFKYPVIPQKSILDLDPSEIHNSLMGCKFISLLKTLECDARDGDDLPMGILQEVMEWLRVCPKEYKFRFNPTNFFKILGHTFGLLGKYEYQYRGVNYTRPTTCKVNFEGFSNALGKKVIMQDIMDYLRVMENCKFSKENKEKIATMCSKTYVVNQGYGPPPSDNELMELMHLLDNDIPITIITGWEGHSVNITMNKKELFFINKGDQSGSSPGLNRFKIEQEITKTILYQILTLNKASDFPNGGSTTNALSNILKLKFLETHKSSAQKVGCCVFASNRLSFKAAAILLGESLEIANSEFKTLTIFNRIRWFHWLQVIIQREETDQSLETELYFALYCIFLKYCLKTRLKKTLSDLDSSLLREFTKRFEGLKKKRSHPYLEAISQLIAKKFDISVFISNPSHYNLVQETIYRCHDFYLQ